MKLRIQERKDWNKSGAATEVLSSLWKYRNLQKWADLSLGRQIKPHISTFAQNGAKWNNINFLLHNFFFTKHLKLIFPSILLQFWTLCEGSLDIITISVSLRTQTYKHSLIPCKQDNVLGCLFRPHCKSPFDISQSQVIFFFSLSLSGNQISPAGFPA